VKCATPTQIWGSNEKDDDACDTRGQLKDNPIGFCQQPVDTTTATTTILSSSLSVDDNGCRTIPNGSEDCHRVVDATALPTTDCNSGNKPCDTIAAAHDDDDDKATIGGHRVLSSKSTTVTATNHTNRNDDDDENEVVAQPGNHKKEAEEEDEEEDDDKDDNKDVKASSATTSSLMEDDLQSPACPICMEPFRPGDAVCLPTNERCNHNFHVECMKDWLMKHAQCPCCRESYLLEYTRTTTRTTPTMSPRQQEQHLQ
jgi:hypothetical protein